MCDARVAEIYIPSNYRYFIQYCSITCDTRCAVFDLLLSDSPQCITVKLVFAVICPRYIVNPGDTLSYISDKTSFNVGAWFTKDVPCRYYEFAWEGDSDGSIPCALAYLVRRCIIDHANLPCCR